MYHSNSHTKMTISNIFNQLNHPFRLSCVGQSSSGVDVFLFLINVYSGFTFAICSSSRHYKNIDLM